MCLARSLCGYLGGSPRSPDVRAGLPSRRIIAGLGEVLDESCCTDLEDELVLELEDSPGTDKNESSTTWGQCWLPNAGCRLLLIVEEDGQNPRRPRRCSSGHSQGFSWTGN